MSSETENAEQGLRISPRKWPISDRRRFRRFRTTGWWCAQSYANRSPPARRAASTTSPARPGRPRGGRPLYERALAWLLLQPRVTARSLCTTGRARPLAASTTYNVGPFATPTRHRYSNRTAPASRKGRGISKPSFRCSKSHHRANHAFSRASDSGCGRVRGLSELFFPFFPSIKKGRFPARLQSLVSRRKFRLHRGHARTTDRNVRLSKPSK